MYECCAKHIDYNHAIIDWNLLAALKSITENTFYGKKIQFVVSKINKLIIMWCIFNGLKKKKENLIALKAQKNSTLAASENQTHDSLCSRLDSLTTELLELYGEKTWIHWYPFSDTLILYVSVMF